MDIQSWLTSPAEEPQFEGLSSQAMRVRARRLAAYLPRSLVRQILEGTLPPPGTAVWLKAATLFSDMSGFTRMAEALAVDGPRGAEELNRVLLMTFTGLINAIHDAGGSVVHFHGDAMMVYFPDEDGRAAERALACADFMQSLMQTSLGQITTSHPDQHSATFSLSIKVGVSYGRCCQVVVGRPDDNLEFVLGGTAVDEAVLAQQQALAGQVVAARAVLRQVGLPADEEFRIVSEYVPVPNARQSLHWHAYEVEALKRLLTIGPAFIPSALVDRLQNETTLFIAGHRSVTSMFVQFTGIDYATKKAGQQLQVYYEWAGGIVARFGPGNGRVNRFLTGDKGNQIHILFGAPVAPDAPEQAIRCALALQREKPDFIREQRIGLAVGAVFATAVGSQNRREYTAVGRVVNLSAHLTQHCPLDGIVLDEQTARRVWQQFEFDPLPAATLKGHQEPMALYRVAGEPPAPTQLSARFTRWQKTPLGREEELAQINQHIQAALRGEGGLIALTGPFGGGIRPLLAEGLRQWLAAGGRGLAGVCQPHLADVPFAPWQSIWRDFFGLSTRISPEMQTMAVEETIRVLIPNWADEAPLWLAAMGLPVREDKTVSIAPSVRQVWLFSLIQRCLVQSARTQPLLILLEDVHWADRASLDLIAELATEATHQPLMLIITFRSTENLRLPLLNQPECTTIALKDWSVDQARTIARRRLGIGKLPLLIEQRLGLRDQHGREAEAVNPLFLEESLKIMLSLDVLHFDEEGDRVTVDETRLTRLQVPDTIATLLQARLDAIPASALSLLQMAAVIGREFELGLLLSLNQGMTWAEAAPLIESLVDAELIQPVGDESDTVYMFQHTLLHEVVYQSLPYARRQAIHLAIAERLKQGQYQGLTSINALLAHHYTQANQPEAGLRYSLAGALEAAAIFANRSAADLYNQALMHLQTLGLETQPDTAVAILLAQAEVHRLLGEYIQAEKAAMGAKTIILDRKDDLALISVNNLLAEIRLRQGRVEEADMLARSRINKKTMALSPPEMARAYNVAGLAALAHFDLELADDNLRRARLILQNDNASDLLPLVLANLGQTRFWLKAPERALSLCRQAVDLAQHSEQPMVVGQVMLALARITFRHGDCEEAKRVANEAMELVRMTNPQLLAGLYTQRAELHLYDGRYPEALADLQKADGLYAQMEDNLGQLRLHLLWGGGYWLMNEDWESALSWLDKAQRQLARLLRAGGTAVLESVQLRLGLAQIAIHTQQWAQAEKLLLGVESELTAMGLIWWQPECLYWQSQVMVARDRAAEAEGYLLAAIDAVSNGGNPDQLPLILLALGLLLPEADGRHWQYLELCVVAAYNRAKTKDKLRCLKEAGQALTQAPDLRLRRIGAGCLATGSNAT